MEGGTAADIAARVIYIDSGVHMSASCVYTTAFCKEQFINYNGYDRGGYPKKISSWIRFLSDNIQRNILTAVYLCLKARLHQN